jgi:hypothetical protein
MLFLLQKSFDAWFLQQYVSGLLKEYFTGLYLWMGRTAGQRIQSCIVPG